MGSQQALDPAAYLFEGFWVNQAKGNIKGGTLTLCPTSANLLISTLGIFVTMAGRQLWTILRFVIHQIRATPQSKTNSMLHRHQQVILRNSTTDLASARLLFILYWAWRKQAKNVFSTSMPMILLAVGHSVLFMVAGTLASTATNAGPTVLSRSPYCGTLNASYIAEAGEGINPNAFGLSLEFTAKKEREIQLSQEYARECYNLSESDSLSSSCGVLQQPRFNWTQTNVACPFAAQICGDSGTIAFDTGLINSRDDFGINAVLSDQLSYRRVTTCTVLNDTSYVSGWNDESTNVSSQPLIQQAYANLGPNQFRNTTETYSYSNFVDFYTKYTAQTTTPYQVDVQFATPGSFVQDGTFVPIPELSQRFADLTVFFISYTGSYAAPVDDPLFAAHQPELNHRKVFPVTYTRDRPISTMGCIEQHQLCLTAHNCTPALALAQLNQYLDMSFVLTPNQNVTWDRILSATGPSILQQVVPALALGSTPLLAMDIAVGGESTLSSGLPSDQWKAEAAYWHSVAMAHLQRTFAEYGTGQIAAQTAFITGPTTDSGKWLCENMMVQGTNMQSFSVLGLSLIAGLGTLTIVISLIIENLASCIQKRMGRGATRMEMWIDNDMLQLQLWTGKKAAAPQPPPKQVKNEEKRPDNDKQAGRALTRKPERDVERSSKPQKTSLSGTLPNGEKCTDAVPSPNIGHMIHAVSLASYREGFRAGYQGAWV